MANLTLYSIEDELAAFVDTEELVPEDLREQYALAMGAKNDAAVTKRDNVIRAIRFLEDQRDLAKAEEERIREHRKRVEAALERFRSYVAGVVDRFGEQKPGQKTKTLHATIGVLRCQQSPGKIVIEDEAVLPGRFCRAVVTFDRADDWERMYKTFFSLPEKPELQGGFKPEREPLKERIAEAIDAGEEVPGADRAFGEWGLRLK